MSLSAVLALAARQHGLVTRGQLLELGVAAESIKHRLRRGWLHPARRGVYAVGRPQLTRHGRWMAGVLACGPDALLRDESAAVLWGMRRREPSWIELAVASGTTRRGPGLRVRRRKLAAEDITTHAGIPVTSPTRTLLDLATKLRREELEAAIDAADRLDLIDPERLRAAVERHAGTRGAAALRKVLDRATFRLTDSELERRFLRIVAGAGLGVPLTRRRVNGFRVDFWWPESGIVVETDGLRYHRTPAQQARDRLRDQAHTAAGLRPLRFTHAQVAFDPERVRGTLLAVAARGPSRRAPRASRSAPAPASRATPTPAARAPPAPAGR